MCPDIIDNYEEQIVNMMSLHNNNGNFDNNVDIYILKKEDIQKAMKPIVKNKV